MSEKNKENSIHQQDCRCPFCPYMFSSKLDLQKHMDCFGNRKAEHAEFFRNVHGRLEYGAFSEQEG